MAIRFRIDCVGQGDYWPGCGYCRNVDFSSEIRHCLLHDIPIPDLREDGDFLCSDWKLMETSNLQLWSWIKGLPELYRRDLDALKPGILYYYAGWQQEPPHNFWGKLDSLKSIKNYMFRSEIRSHKKYGWIIYPDFSKENYAHLPRVDRKCDLSLDGERFEFSVGRILEKKPKKIRINEKGESVPEGWRLETDRIVYSPRSPEALKIWANKYFDIDAIARKRGHVYEYWDWGISVFMEVIKPKESYSLRPALHFNPRFVRDKTLLKDE